MSHVVLWNVAPILTGIENSRRVLKSQMIYSPLTGDYRWIYNLNQQVQATKNYSICIILLVKRIVNSQQQ